jgi:hypothetical protein
MCLSVSQSVCLSVCLFCLSDCPSVCLSACLYFFVCLSACLSAFCLCLFLCLPVCLSVCISAFLSVCIFICLSLCVSVVLSACQHFFKFLQPPVKGFAHVCLLSKLLPFLSQNTIFFHQIWSKNVAYHCTYSDLTLFSLPCKLYIFSDDYTVKIAAWRLRDRLTIN